VQAAKAEEFPRLARQNGWPVVDDLDKAELEDRVKLMFPELTMFVLNPRESEFLAHFQDLRDKNGPGWYHGHEGIAYRFDAAHGG
jgi:hypothetical protein